MIQELTVSAVAAHIGGEIRGDETIKITGVADLGSAQTGEIVFVEDVKFFEQAKNSSASCLIAPESSEIEFANAIILVKNPKLAFAQIAALLHPPKKQLPQIHPSAIIAENSIIAQDVFVGAFACIGEKTIIGAGTQISAGARIGDEVRVGENCVVHPNVFLADNVTIGDKVILHAGVVVGADGFGYVRVDAPDGYVKFPQIGTIVIEDEVEIGANTCIDRAALGETRIGRGTKIDNLVQIAHNVSIGERVIIAAQTGISGSVVIESDVVIGGQVGIGDHVRILSGAVIGSKAGVLPGKIVRAGVWWGIPVQPLDDYKRQNARLKALPRWHDEVKQLRQRLQQIEQAIDPGKFNEN